MRLQVRKYLLDILNSEEKWGKCSGVEKENRIGFVLRRLTVQCKFGHLPNLWHCLESTQGNGLGFLKCTDLKIVCRVL